MPGPGTTANVIAAICSFFIPGLGQLVQGRILGALFFFVLVLGILWLLTALTFFIIPFWGLAHIWACIDAALWKGR